MNQLPTEPREKRYPIIVVSMVMAFMLYLHRVCLSEIAKNDAFRQDLDLSKERIGEILGAFFFTYALCQVPAGWFSDRWGARRMLTGYIFGWSALTAVTGLVTGPLGILWARLGVGVTQAGAYPTSSGVVRHWFSVSERGRASSMISIGGRLGGALSPLITATLIIYLGGWRATLLFFGGAGCLAAVAYYWIVRDRPAHPPGSQTVAQFEAKATARHQQKASFRTVLSLCATSRNLWLNALAQFSINLGWAFLITWLPSYLKDVKQVESSRGALLVTIVLAMGIVGQFMGGWVADLSVRTFGLRFGRVLPITVGTWAAGFAYFGCISFDSVTAVVICCAIVSLMNDIANPSIWAFIQDIGGRSTASFFGWGNMWGNLGAATLAVILPYLMKWGEASGYGQSVVFWFCGGAFLLAGLCALGMNPTRPVDPLS